MVGILIAIGVIALFILILHLPLGVCIKYDGTTPYIHLLFWFIKIKMIPKKVKKTAKKQKIKDEKPKETKKKQKKKPILSNLFGKSGKINTILDIFKLIKRIAGKFKRFLSHMKIKINTCDIAIAGTDAADAAIKYGAICAAVYPVMGYLSSKIDYNYEKINLYAKYDDDETDVNLDIKITIKSMFYILTTFRVLKDVVEYFINRQNNKKTIKNQVNNTKPKTVKGEQQ